MPTPEVKPTTSERQVLSDVRVPLETIRLCLELAERHGIDPSLFATRCMTAGVLLAEVTAEKGWLSFPLKLLGKVRFVNFFGPSHNGNGNSNGSHDA